MYTKIIAGLGIAGMLLSAAPMAMARENGNDDVRANASAQAKVEHEDNGLHLGTVLGLHLGAKHEDNDGDDDDNGNRGGISSTTKAKLEAERAAFRSHVTGGTVTAVNGSTFTVVGRDGATTTVTTDGQTVFKSHGATTTSAVTVGSHIVAIGSTTASSTPTNGEVFAATIVKIFGAGWGHFKAFLHF